MRLRFYRGTTVVQGSQSTDVREVPKVAQKGTVKGDDILAEARQLAAEGGELLSHHVRALEHPDEFAGQDVPDPNATPDE